MTPLPTRSRAPAWERIALEALPPDPVTAGLNSAVEILQAEPALYDLPRYEERGICLSTRTPLALRLNWSLPVLP